MNAYYPVFGVRLIVLAGITTFASMLATIAIAVMNKNGIHVIAFKWHIRMAMVTALLATFHAYLAIFG